MSPPLPRPSPPPRLLSPRLPPPPPPHPPSPHPPPRLTSPSTLHPCVALLLRPPPSTLVILLPFTPKGNFNSNPRRSTSHKTLPHARSSSPSDLPRSLSAQKPSLYPTPKPKPKPKPKPSLKPKPSTTSQEGTNTISNNNYPSKLDEKLAFLEG
ncbi:hypothetical protein Fmac_017441 [Flemingia macrophylla]|uniref:Uncharacterized protein n=1 Tax=Flemingia macrophylla TaxID=520843 RepID=A0ABD1M254_9FABA